MTTNLKSTYDAVKIRIAQANLTLAGYLAKKEMFEAELREVETKIMDLAGLDKPEEVVKIWEDKIEQRLALLQNSVLELEKAVSSFQQVSLRDKSLDIL